MATTDTATMTPETDDYRQMPGLYRLWDLQFVIDRHGDWQVHYAETTEDGAPLFAVFRREGPGRGLQ